MICRLASAVAIATCLSGGASAQQVDEVRTGVEDSLIPPQFVKCDRPENTIAISSDRARSGRKSLWLAISKSPPRRKSVAAGSMGPKVEAACSFVESTGGIAGIGALGAALAILEGRAGTLVVADAAKPFLERS